MESWKRHRIIWRLLYRLCSGWICRRFSMTHEDLHIDGPVLLVPNHVSAWDPLLVAMSLREKQVYYVASEHLFRLGLVTRLLNWLVAPIPRRKASSGADTVKACLRHLREGHSVCLFAEGEQSWDGLTAPIFPATGKLARSSGATLVTYRLEGAYLSLPRWARTRRRGAVYGHPVGIYPPERLREMSPQEIDAAIARDIAEDTWERQRQKPVRFRGKRLAEGLERALYACPGCKRLGTLRTENDRILCPCGFESRYTETGFFEPETPFADIAAWDRWQRELLRSRGFTRAGEALFCDGGMALLGIGAHHSERPLGVGTLYQYEDSLVFGERRFPLAQIDSMALVQTHLLLFSFQGDYYQLRTRAGANLRKYLEVWKER